MKKLLKDRKLLIAGAVVLILIVLGALFVANKNSKVVTENTNVLPTQIPIPTVTSEELGLTLKPGPSGKTVIVTVANTQGIASIDYELSYNSKGDIPRGAIGTLDLKRKPVVKEITLGTCSDVCHYDTDVSDIKLVLKLTKEDGKVYQAQATLASVTQ